ncbi:LPXTG cell wall anchor domain-containing protein [Phycicoccus avicenniae]|uniref:LPXTG cell wall anchor domain-containing protein n=1 Tax=Phycicoccus avicenniae TaxID=2828860 RepID=UPI003D2C18A8
MRRQRGVVAGLVVGVLLVTAAPLVARVVLAPFVPRSDDPRAAAPLVAVPGWFPLLGLVLVLAAVWLLARRRRTRRPR